MKLEVMVVEGIMQVRKHETRSHVVEGIMQVRKHEIRSHGRGRDHAGKETRN